MTMRLGLALLVVLAVMPVAAAAADDYRIGIDDVLSISVWDNKDLEQVVFVRPDGKISLPLLGEVKAGGLTVAELADALTAEYSKTVKEARVTVGVKEIRSRAVFFVGSVQKPGPLHLTQDLGLLQAISLAGGLTPIANAEAAFIIRRTERIPIDLVSLIQNGNLKFNVKLEPGDTIVVPGADVVYVQGEVKQPGPVKFTKELTMVKLIAQVGGFTTLAAPNRVTLLRGKSNGRENRRINVRDMIDGPENAADIPLEPNDIIIVPQRLF